MNFPDSLLLRGGTIVDVQTDTLVRADILIEHGTITTVGQNLDVPVGTPVEDVSGKIICPGFIDGHIHIESSLMVASRLAEVCAAHGTAAIVADPHEIANVCGTDGLRYMLEAAKDLPVDIFFALPSCVPATPFEESGAELHAEDLRPFYREPSVVALGEMMNYPGVLAGGPDVLQKIADAKAAYRVVNGHAPGLLGEDLQRYIDAGVNDDHECSTFEEAADRVQRGMWVMIREGSAARNLEALMPLFASEFNTRCLLVTDDKHADDLLESGHIDAIIRKAVSLGADPLVAIRMATKQAAECLQLTGLGVIAPSYTAHLVALDNLCDLQVTDVWHYGIRLTPQIIQETCCKENHSPFFESLDSRVRMTCNIFSLKPEDFLIEPPAAQCKAHVIGVEPGTLITQDLIYDLDFSETNGTDPSREIAKIAVCERHKHTGHRGLGFISGLGLKRGAVASTVAHDSHNLIVVGTNEEDMALAANTVIAAEGGRAVVQDGEVLAVQALPIAGLMSDEPAAEVAKQTAAIDDAIQRIGCAEGIDPVMNMAFSSLTVIPHLKMTTLGPVDVDTQQVISLFMVDNG